MTIMLLAGLTSWGQQKNCYTNSEVDSIYSKLIQRKILTKQNKALNYALHYSDSLVLELKDKINLLEDKMYSLGSLIQEKDNKISNLSEQLKVSNKIHRRKKTFSCIKGIGVGVGLTGILFLLK